MNNITNANDVNSRRSACDRCRGHKLRCVRPSGSSFSTAVTSPSALPACERCVKAGAECLHTVSMRRASMRGGRHERAAAGSRPSVAGFRDQNNFTPSTQRVDQSRIPVGPQAQTRKLSGQLPPSSRDTHRHAANIHSHEPNTISSSLTTAADGDIISRTGLSFELGEGFGPGSSNFPTTFGAGLPRPELGNDFSLDPLFGEGSDKMIESTKSNSTTIKNSVSSEANQPSQEKSQLFYRLSELSSKLMHYFGRADDGFASLEDILSYSTSMNINDIDNAEADARSTKNIIGILLQSSQIFLEILEELECFVLHQRDRQGPSSPSNSEYSYVDSPNDTELLFGDSMNGTQTQSSEFVLHQDEIDEMASQFRTTKNYVPIATASTTAARITAILPACHSRQVFFSMPHALTIITCYMWLLHGYQMVFAAIQESLILQRQQSHSRNGSRDSQKPQVFQHSALSRTSDSKRTEPFVLPNMQLGGFCLDGHPNLQIEMLIHVSCQVLERIKKILGIDLKEECKYSQPPPALPPRCQDRGVLHMTCVPALLHMHLNGMGGGDVQSSQSDLWDMIKSIRQLLSNKA